MIQLLLPKVTLTIPVRKTGSQRYLLFECLTENIFLKAAMIFTRVETRKKDKDTYSMIFRHAY